MRVLLAGSIAPGALEHYCHRALLELGHSVMVHDRHSELEVRSRFTSTPVLAELEQIPLRQHYNRILLRLVKEWQPDLVFLVKGIELFARTLQNIRNLPQRPLLANWNPDSPFDFATANTNKQLINSIPLYDAYFIWDKDLFAPLKNAGASRVEYLPFAYDPVAHAPVTPSEDEYRELCSEVCFVGGYTPKRAAQLEQITQFDLKVWGTNWERLATNSPLRKHIAGGWKAEGEMSKVFNSAVVTLNFIRQQNGQAHNMRTFEAPATGAFMLSTRTRDQQMWLPDSVGAAYFDSPDEMTEKVRHYVTFPDEAKEIAEEGHRRITSGGHTYKDRMKTLIDVTESL